MRISPVKSQIRLPIAKIRAVESGRIVVKIVYNVASRIPMPPGKMIIMKPMPKLAENAVARTRKWLGDREKRDALNSTKTSENATQKTT